MVDQPRLTMEAFAATHGVSKQAASKWKEQGRLVFVDGKVDLVASDAKLAGANLGRFKAAKLGSVKSEDVKVGPAAARAAKPKAGTRAPKPQSISRPQPPAIALPDETVEEAAERPVFGDGRVFSSEAEAKRHKESFLALMRELDYDRENGAVVPVDDVVATVAAEYALVRNRLLNIATRVAPRAAILRSAEEVRALIDAEVALALQELSLDGRGNGDAAARDAVRGRFRKPH